MTKALSIDIILVPQGAEYQAVCRGLRQTTFSKPLVLPIPIGFDALSSYLEKWKQSQDFLNQSPSRVLLMGLGGSLSRKYRVGDIVLYQGCFYRESWQECDRHLTNLVHQRLQEKVFLVRGLTSDRLIWSAQEKYDQGQRYQADIVDMESFAVLAMFNPVGIAVAIVRVISDDAKQTLPNLTSALSPDGFLQPFPLAVEMLKQPIAATRLIWSSLRGLKRLQQVTAELISH